MKQFVLVVFALAVSVTGAQAAERLTAVIIDGANNHDWRSTTDALRATLEATGRFDVRAETVPRDFLPRVPRAKDPNEAAAVQALFKKESDAARKFADARWEAWSPSFEDADVVVLNYNGRHWPQRVRDDFVAYVKGGGGVVLVHAANNAFTDWDEFNTMIAMGWRKGGFGRAMKVNGDTGKPYAATDADLPGGGNSGHGSKHPFRVTVRAPAHPIMRGLPKVWAHASDELYHNMRGPLENVTVLDSSYSDPKERGSGLHEPTTWEVAYGKGRVIVTSMGHLWLGDLKRGEPTSLYCLGFQTVFARSCEYAATGSVTLAVPDGFPGAEQPVVVAPHRMAWGDQVRAEPSAASVSMRKKKVANPYVALSPDEERATFEIAPGYVVECFASEPMVEEPVLTVWDGDGAMYVAEMRSYMQNVTGAGTKTMRNGRVKRLVDTDGDGRADRATVFIDSLNLPRMILPLSDGWIAVRESDTMDVFAYRDTDGDGVHDEKKMLYQGGTDGRHNPDKSVEHQDSGLMWNLDNHIYITYNSERYRYTTGEWKAERQRGHWTQWGLTHDDSGDLFWVHNSGPLVDSYLHPRYWTIPARNGVKNIPSIPVVMPDPYDPAFMLADTICTLNDRGGTTPARRAFTSACGQSIYRGDKFPVDARGDYFVCDPTLHVVRRANVNKSGGMIRLTKAEPDGYEFLRSSDINCRFVNTAEGPDGCLYVTDMYRGIIQDAPWLNEGARKSIVDNGLDKNIRRGRIWRIRHKDFKPRTPGETPAMRKESTLGLVRHLASGSGWWRDTAQREIILRKDRETVAPHLAAIARHAQDELERLHALWTLEGFGEVELELLAALCKDRSPRVRRAVVQIAEPRLGDDAVFAAIAKPLATEKDAGVARQLILSLGYTRSHPEALALIQTLARRHASVWGVQVATTLSLWGERDTPLAKQIIAGKADGALDAGAMIQWKNHLGNWGRGLRFPDAMPVADRRFIAAGEVQYFKHCVTCHGADGRGLNVPGADLSLAPSLVDSKRVRGKPARLIPVFVNGLIGPIDGKNYQGAYMAPAGALGIARDDRLAELISYIRFVHGEGASIVRPDEVKHLRQKFEKERETPWTDAELDALP